MARAKAKAKRGKKKSALVVDLSGVESSGRLKAGPQRLTVDEIEENEGDAGPYLTWILSGENGGKCWENTSLAESALWKLRGILEALGMEIPDEEFTLELEEYVGLELMGSIELETYQGKDKPVLVDCWPIEEEDDDEDEDEEDSDEEDSEEEDEDEEDEDEEEDEEDEEDESEFSVKDKVTFEDDGEEYKGTITEIDGDTVTVKTGRGKTADEWELDISDIEAA